MTEWCSSVDDWCHITLIGPDANIFFWPPFHVMPFTNIYINLIEIVAMTHLGQGNDNDKTQLVCFIL